MMQRIKTNVALWLCLTGISSFWAIWFLIGPAVTTELASSLMLGCGVMLMATWFLPAFRAVRNQAIEGSGLMSLGIFGVATVLVWQRIFIIVVRMLDYPDELIQGFLPPLNAWSMFFFLALMVLAPGTTDGAVPGRNYWYLTGAIAFGALVAGISIGASILR